MSHHIAVLGAGSAGVAVARRVVSLRPESRVVIFEPRRVGGECPYVACIPSKSMLHDGRSGRDWASSLERRRELTDGLDDDGHVDELRELGVDLVRAAGTIVGPRTVVADGETYSVDHIVIATGAHPVVPEIDGLDEIRDRVWTSRDAMTTATLPDRLVVLGAGVVGCESAELFADFGCDVVLLDRSDRPLDDAPPAVSDRVAANLRERGVDLRLGVEVVSVGRHGDRVAVSLGDARELRADRLLLAVGRAPTVDSLGLESLGVDPAEPLPIDPNGRVRCDGSVWAVGDVAGRGEYTHLANFQGEVVADHLAGTGTRTFDEVVVPGCVFVDPPVFQVGPSWAELGSDDDPDIVTTMRDLSALARPATDELAEGVMWMAARRSTGCVVAACGVGPRFDELGQAIVTAIDGRVPIARLRRSMYSFPTVAEILGQLYDDLFDELSAG